MNGKCDEKEEEKAVVSAPDAVRNPRAVMIEGLRKIDTAESISNASTIELRTKTHLDAVITHGTMGASWRSIEFTCHAPLHSNGDAVDFSVFVERRSELVFAVLIGRR